MEWRERLTAVDIMGGSSEAPRIRTRGEGLVLPLQHEGAQSDHLSSLSLSLLG